MTEARVGRALVTGAAWVTLGEVLAGLGSLVTSIVGARVLSPADFGLMGIVTLAIAVLDSLTTSGFSQALVQKDRDVEPLLDVAWTWHVFRGSGIALLLCLAAPLLSRFYAEPRLTGLLMVSSLYIVIHGLHNIGTVFFDRKLDFRTQFAIKLGQTAMSVLVYVPAVLFLRNVWALSIAYVGGAVAHVVISYVSQPYRPRLAWDPPKLRQLLSYGRWITGMTFMGFVIIKGDDIFVSKFLGLTALGFYQLAYSVAMFPATNVTHVISRVSFPTYARLQHDKEELRKAFLRVTRTTLLLGGVSTAIIWSLIPLFVTHVIGSKWQAIVPLVRILVVAGFVRCFAALAGPIFQGLGRPDLDVKMNLPRFVLTLALIWPACARYGLEGACWVVLAAIATTLPTWFWGVRALTGISPFRILREVLLALVPSAALGGALWFLTR
ncbi:MAG: lipopolysaccharide biosynthesis protein [Myxococcales bacterium]|nr:lipopolysaccharide biosynthesis protein [Myxococcales bacterium]